MCFSANVEQDINYLGKSFTAFVDKRHFHSYSSQASKDPKSYPVLDSRIFPAHYAPIVFSQNGRATIELMRYGTFPPEHLSHPKYTSFNVRCDNLSSPYWSNAFRKVHGFCVLKSFFEWVSVSDLLRAGVVKLAEIEAEFSRQTTARKKKILSQGKKYKPTATELKPSLQRQTMIEFVPEDGSQLLVPVICSQDKSAGEFHQGFAIITDTPTAEIAAAGHDRCPVILTEYALDDWLSFSEKSPHELVDLLQSQKRLSFKHRLAQAA